jgi:hypothetical protein
MAERTLRCATPVASAIVTLRMAICFNQLLSRGDINTTWGGLW